MMINKHIRYLMRLQFRRELCEMFRQINKR